MSQPVSDFKRSVQDSTKVPGWGKLSLQTPPQTPAHAQAQQASSSSSQQQQQSTSGQDQPNLVPIGGKKKKHKSDIVYSQPADTGGGKSRGTQLARALDYLRKSSNPMRIEDLAAYCDVPLLTDSLLFEAFENDPNVVKNLQNGLYEYKRVYYIRTPAQLLDEIRVKGRDGGGLSVKLLKETFPDVQKHIEELELDGKVLVTRNAKDNTPKFVFWNDITPEQGGKMVDAEFVKLWDEIRNPAEADFRRALEKAGLQATISEDLPAQAAPKKKGKKPKEHNRATKITNTHITNVDLTRDYVKPSA